MLKRATQILFVAVIVVFSYPVSFAHAQPSSSNSDSETIMSLTGLRFPKIFTLYGTPDDIYALRGETTDDDGVMLDYNAFSFKVRNKIIEMSLFWKDYAGDVKGFHIGDSKSKVIDKMGKTDNIHELSDGRVTYYWELSDYYFGVIFDKNDEAVTFKTESK